MEDIQKKKQTKNTDEEDISVGLKINIDLAKKYTGALEQLTKDTSVVHFTPTDDMCLDISGLIHSSFLMSAVEYCVYCVVNRDTTYIQSVKAEYLAPLEAGLQYIISSEMLYADGKKRTVFVKATHNDFSVFDATFNVLVLDEHILDVKLNEK